MSSSNTVDSELRFLRFHATARVQIINGESVLCSRNFGWSEIKGLAFSYSPGGQSGLSFRGITGFIGARAKVL
jgi:hypothetical protein